MGSIIHDNRFAGEACNLLSASGGYMEKRIRMWLKACLIIAGLLFFCFLAGRRERGTDYEKEARIRQYEADESVEKIRTTLLEC